MCRAASAASQTEENMTYRFKVRATCLTMALVLTRVLGPPFATFSDVAMGHSLHAIDSAQ